MVEGHINSNNGIFMGKAMKIKEAYEKYKHLDANLSDRDLLPESFWGSILLDLWSAIKEATKDQPE